MDSYFIRKMRTASHIRLDFILAGQLTGYCIDAVEYLPAGSWYSFAWGEEGEKDEWGTNQTFVWRPQ